MNSLYLQKNLQWLIRENGRSLTQLAVRAKMKKSTLHGYLNGVIPRALPALIELAEILHVPPEDLLFKDLQKKPPSSPPRLAEGRYELILKWIAKE